MLPTTRGPKSQKFFGSFFQKRTFFLLFFAAATAQAATLDHIKAAGHLTCGLVTEASDETKADTHGNLSGLGQQFCRAVGAAVLGAKPQLRLQGYPTAALAYQALQHGDIDLMVGDTPQAGLARRYGVVFTQPIFFDGQGLLVHKDRGIFGLTDLAGKQVCFIGNTDADTRLTVAADAAHITVGRFPFEEIGEMEAALVDGHCAAETHDVSKLAVDRTAFHGMVRDFVILPDRLSLDPYAPAVRDNDPAWARVVDGVLFALVQAEQDGVTQANAAALRTSTDPTVLSLVGTRSADAWGLELPGDWSFQAIEAVGNYGEMLARTTGDQSLLRLPRGPNALAGRGGLVWAPPVR
jgi:general L-amino acid transport system substrate-binding protein